MPGVSRLQDLNSGEACFPPTPSIEGSTTVNCDGLPVINVGKIFLPHQCGSESSTLHAGMAASGSSTVFVEGLPICRIGDPVSCGATIIQGSVTVFAN